MHPRPWIAGLALSGLLVCVGCVSQSELQGVENEIGDLKLEVFKLRTQMEDANKKLDEDRGIAFLRNLLEAEQADRIAEVDVLTSRT